ncbi:MAG: ATP-dependent sacrificial sulfur transferase LarE [Actinomycetota bacterium]|nr:ATP-dependent sacrificial sulfur transferase LarE [Actinomycetota bacterium]
MQRDRLVVGFDLDLTLVDSRAGFRATVDAVGRELGVRLPAAELAQRLGPPLDHLLAGYLPADRMAEAVTRFRELYPDLAVGSTRGLPGAQAALAAVREEHGEIVVVTGKYTANARRHIEHLGLDVDVVEGEVWGAGKAEVLLRHGCSVYVGDHVHDVAGARAAGVASVSVLTGGCSREELSAAGTDAVLADLTEFPAWLERYLLANRLDRLQTRLRAAGSVLVAFSGGADSAFLLAAAVRALGTEHVAAATAYSPSLPVAEREPALSFARSLGVKVFTPATDELGREGYRANAGDRCAFCKAELLDVLTPLARQEGYAVVATGTNADDFRAGFRPGIAAADSRGAATPLLDAGLTKAQIRRASADWALPTWDKPAAACLSSRVAYGIEITAARLARVERAESGAREALTRAGIDVRDLRVRDLGDTARIEVDRDAVPGATASAALRRAVLAAGFEQVEVDPLGFRSGSMNDLLAEPSRYR